MDESIERENGQRVDSHKNQHIKEHSGKVTQIAAHEIVRAEDKFLGYLRHHAEHDRGDRVQKIGDCEIQQKYVPGLFEQLALDQERDDDEQIPEERDPEEDHEDRCDSRSSVV